ncbi:MAG: 30S ribosomal protein S6 [Bacillota bacterium]
MGLYEIMIIIRPDLEDEEHEEIIDGLTKNITENEGQVDKVVDWHKRRFAYEIDKHVEGHYYLVYFSSTGQIIPELEHFFRVNDAILRYLIMRVEEEVYETAIQEEADQSDQTVETESEAEVADQEAAEPGETEVADQEAAESSEALVEPEGGNETEVTTNSSEESKTE